MGLRAQITKQKGKYLCIGILTVLFLLTACGKKERTVDAALGDEVPVKLIYYYQWGTSETYETQDRELIQEVLQAIQKIHMEKKTDLMATDSDDVFVFVLENGELISFSFNDHHLQYEGAWYELSQDAPLWKLAKELKNTKGE